MTTFLAIASAFVLEIVYGVLPDTAQSAWAWEVVQGQKVLFGIAALTALNYRTPLGKGMILLALIWATWVLITDWWIPQDWPSWMPAVEGAVFLIWLVYLRWKHGVVSRGQATGRTDGNAAVSNVRTRRRRRPDRR